MEGDWVTVHDEMFVPSLSFHSWPVSLFSFHSRFAAPKSKSLSAVQHEEWSREQKIIVS